MKSCFFQEKPISDLETEFFLRFVTVLYSCMLEIKGKYMNWIQFDTYEMFNN